MDESWAARRQDECILNMREMGIIAASRQSRGMIILQLRMKLGQASAGRDEAICDKKESVSKAKLTNLSRVHRNLELRRLTD